MYFCNLVIIFPWKRGEGASSQQIWILFTMDALCQVWLKYAQWFWKRRIFLKLSIYFHYFVIISTLKRAGPLIWIKLNSLQLSPLWKGRGPLLKKKMNSLQGWFVLSLVEIGPVVLEKKIFKILNVFSLFCNNLPLE